MTLFTYLSILQFRAYDDMTSPEIIFWIFNAGYVANELQQIFSSGLKGYFSDSQKYFDSIISAVFVASIIIRLWALISGPDCTDDDNNNNNNNNEESIPLCSSYLDSLDDNITYINETTIIPCSNLTTTIAFSNFTTSTIDDDDDDVPCWSDSHLNTSFVILWGIATITLWLRIVNFFILSHSLGPMVAMIFRMLSDIATFFEIMLILFLAFAMCLMFILGDVLSDFESPAIACITLFRALLGDFDFDNLADANVSEGILYFGYGIVIFYLVIGSLVLLNLLIAMMAKTFDTIEEDTTAAIIFSRFQLALDRDTSACFMPPPLNVFAMGFLIIFYLIEWFINSFGNICYCCKYGCLCCKKMIMMLLQILIM